MLFPLVLRICAIKCLVFGFILLSYQYIDDYDTSTAMVDRIMPVSSSFDLFVRNLLRPFAQWDAVYFVHITSHIGYAYEHMYAFFPGLPVAMRLFMILLQPLTIFLERIIGNEALLSSRGLTLISGVVVNQLASIKGAVELYKLTKIIFTNKTEFGEKLAYTSAMIFSIGPASVFFFAIYSEALYACFTFWGLRVLANCYYNVRYKQRGIVYEVRELVRAGILIGCTVAIRSTGFAYGLFFAFYFISSYPWIGIVYGKHRNFMHSAIVFCTLIIVAIILLLPLISYQYYAACLYCTENNINVEMSPWCSAAFPNIYKYVQARYWNVGLFNYYQFHQIPNFIIAAPTLILSVFSIVWYVYVSLVSPPKVRSKGFEALILMETIPYFLHWFFLTAIAFTVLHIQVVTRFMSATPPLYWIMACCLHSKRQEDSLLCFWRNSPQKALATLVLSFSLSYLVIGSILHTNFYPWT